MLLDSIEEADRARTDPSDRLSSPGGGMNERAAGPGAAADGWRLASGEQQATSGAEAEQRHESAFAVHPGARALQHRPYPRHASPRLVVKGGAAANGLNELDAAFQHHQHANHHGDAESDADEEVRSLDLPAQVGIDLRSKRTGSVEALDRERPMSWEGELSDQEASQMEHETGRASSPGQQVALTGGRPLKTEPDAEDEEDEDRKSVV